MAAPRHNATDAVYAAVSHADGFDMPLGTDGLQRFVVGYLLSSLQTSVAVDELVRTGRLSRCDDLVYLAGRDGIAEKHADRAARAAAMWTKAESQAKRVGRLPFVRMVAVTGNLAVNSVGEGDAIEFFVVTRPRRLWFTRMMIQAHARQAAKQNVDVHSMCIASTRGLEFSEHTIHLAREIAQMVAVVGGDVCETVRRSNDWIFHFLPNATVSGDTSHLVEVTPSATQKWLEWFLLLPPFRLVENWQRKRWIRRLTKGSEPSSAVLSEDVCAPYFTGRATQVESA